MAVNSINVDDAVFIVTPSDHLISPKTDYQTFLKQAIEVAIHQQIIVLFGISPTSPSTNYGYIEIGDVNDEFSTIQSFHENPIK